jgi:tRNA(Ile2) C34 agmatinyltransferase TiaS
LSRRTGETIGYWLERLYGEDEPTCPRCGGEDLEPQQDSYLCSICGWELNTHTVNMVLRDVRVRRFEEE